MLGERNCIFHSGIILLPYLYIVDIYSSSYTMWVENGPDSQLSSNELEGNHNIIAQKAKSAN